MPQFVRTTRTALLTLGACALLSLTACAGTDNAPRGGGTTAPVTRGPAAPVFTEQTLRDAAAYAMNAADGYSPTDTTDPVGTVQSTAKQRAALFEAAQGTPQACEAVALAEAITTPQDATTTTKARLYGLLGFQRTGTSGYEFLGAAGRLFPDSAAATRFIDQLAATAAACPDGWTQQAASVTGLSAPALSIDLVRGASIESLPTGVRGYALTESSNVGGNDPSYRVSFLQRGNAVVAVSVGAAETETVDYTQADRVVAGVARGLARAS